MDVRLLSSASPCRARSLLTVRAAISSATLSLRPRSSRPSLMCSYWRSRFLLQACCGFFCSCLASQCVPDPGARQTGHGAQGDGYALLVTNETEEADMANLDGKTIAFLVAPEGVEQVELTEPWAAVEKAGGTPRLLSTEAGEVQAFNHRDRADTFEVDAVVADADPATYDGLVLPGGVVNPDKLRMDEDAIGFVRKFFADDKPVAAICHAAWVLVEADVVRGRTVTSWPA